MAVYQWSCKSCNEIMEIKKPIAEYNVPPEECKCGNRLFTKVIGQTSFVLVPGGVAPFHKEEYSSLGRRDKGW